MKGDGEEDLRELGVNPLRQAKQLGVKMGPTLGSQNTYKHES